MRRCSDLFPLFLSASLGAQGVWYQATTSVNPPPRDTHELATEPVSGAVVLFGGVLASNAGQLQDTWEWRGQAWQQMQPQVSPAARETFTMAPDGQGGVLLFGGYTFFVGVQGDTWRYSQGQWQQLQPGNSPSPRRRPRMVRTAQGILLFGGSNAGSTSYFGDTWEWTGSTWVQRQPQHSPSARGGQAMAYDPIRDRVVLFGGFDPARLSDTWEWDGNDWLLMNPASSPPSFGFESMAFHPGIGRCVLYGGYQVGGPHILLCWTWDGNDWTQVSLGSPNPGPRGAPLAWSTASQGLLLFGGLTPLGTLGDTWLTVPTVTASFSVVGTGCTGSAGIPTLTAVPGSLPQIGQTFQMLLGGLPNVAHVSVGVLGFSNSANNSPLGSYSLPFDLTPFGMPGCTQYVSDEFRVFLLALTGQVVWPIPIPPNAGLAGLSFYVQGVVTDSGVNPLGATVTNAGTGVIGG